MTTTAASLDIAASPDLVFAAISDLEQMGRFSPENTGGEWLGGARGPGLGVKFRGANANGGKTWTTTATITEFAPPTKFAFEVTVGPVKVSRWSFELEPSPIGTRITETWLDRRPWLVRRFYSSPVADREAFTVASIATTLERLKAHLEA